MKVKTARLTGRALDWAVESVVIARMRLAGEHVKQWWVDQKQSDPSNYSDDWLRSGPLLTEAHISRTIDHSGLWIAYWTDGYTEGDAGKKWTQCDRSELVAGLRCYVAMTLGDEIDVPEELL